jgi:hypothetical protein
MSDARKVSYPPSPLDFQNIKYRISVLAEKIVRCERLLIVKNAKKSLIENTAEEKNGIKYL